MQGLVRVEDLSQEAVWVELQFKLKDLNYTDAAKLCHFASTEVLGTV